MLRLLSLNRSVLRVGRCFESTAVTTVKKEDKDVQTQEKPINPNALPGGPLAEFFDREENFGKMELRLKQRPGRSWTLKELRLKSNTDLHKLWYVCLKERNMLFTMEHAHKIRNRALPNPERIDRVNETMENIETIVHERNDAYLRLETGEGASPPERKVTSFVGFTYKKQATEHLLPHEITGDIEYEVPYLSEEAHMTQKLWAEKQHLKAYHKADQEEFKNRLKNKDFTKFLRGDRKTFNSVEHLPKYFKDQVTKGLSQKMLFSRLRPGRKPVSKPKVEKIKELDEFLENRDYVGAITLLEHKQKAENDLQSSLWLAYCAYHAGEYQKAAAVYENLLKQKDCPSDVNLYLACTFMMLGMNEEARKFAEKQPKCELQNRILLHLANKAGDTKKTMYHHSLLTTSVEDQMSYAAINFSRGHFAEPMMTYKQLIQEHSTFLALNVYLGLCYYKLEYFDEAIQCANAYLEKYPDSPTAINLQASCLFRTSSPKAAEQHLRKLKHVAESELNFAKDLVLHNSVVFRNGESALQVLPSLVDVVPEARRNLTVYYLKKQDVDAAFGVANGLSLKTPTDYLLKALVYVMLGFERRQQPNIERAAQYFKAVGESKEEENTIIGRLSMAAYYFTNREFNQALTYYNSIVQFNNDDDSFNFNYGQANLFTENYETTADTLSKVKDERYTTTSVYQLGLCRAYIRSKQAPRAWSFYLAHQQSSHVLQMLKLIANDCYQAEEFLHSAMAFDALSHKDTRTDYATAKQGACMGVLKLFTTKRADKDQLSTALHILEKDSSPKSANLVATARKWANEATLLSSA